MKALWHGWRWLRQPYRYFHQEALKKGPTWWAPLPGLGKVLISGEPRVLETVMQEPGLSGGKAHRALRATLGEDHLIVLSGADHRERRRVFLQALRVLPKPEMIAEITRQEFSKQPLNTPFSFHDVGHKASLRIMLFWLLGDQGAKESELLEAAESFQESFGSSLLLYLPWLRKDWGPLSPWGRLLRRRRRLVRLLLEAPRAPDSIAVALESQLSPSGLADELLALLMFGHETTAATLSWCMAHVLAQGVPDGGKERALAFVQESLRVCPAVGQLTRVADRDLSVGEWQVPKGTVVMPAVSLAHESLGPLQEFRPERFAEGSPPLSQYCPFGFGNRLCPGRAAALQQLTTMLQTVQKEFRLLAHGPVGGPARKLFLVVPRGGVRVVRSL